MGLYRRALIRCRLSQRDVVLMTEAQIKLMVDRFLRWKLPANFNPDAGISFDKSYSEKWGGPTGTNLFDAVQADEMVRFMIEGVRKDSFQCAARRQGTAGGNDPADCDWPHCGCDL